MATAFSITLSHYQTCTEAFSTLLPFNKRTGMTFSGLKADRDSFLHFGIQNIAQRFNRANRDHRLVLAMSDADCSTTNENEISSPSTVGKQQTNRVTGRENRTADLIQPCILGSHMTQFVNKKEEVDQQKLCGNCQYKRIALTNIHTTFYPS